MLQWNVAAAMRALGGDWVNEDGTPNENKLTYELGVYPQTARSLVDGTPQAISLFILSKLDVLFRGDGSPGDGLKAILVDDGVALPRHPRPRPRGKKRLAAQAQAKATKKQA